MNTRIKQLAGLSLAALLLATNTVYAQDQVGVKKRAVITKGEPKRAGGAEHVENYEVHTSDDDEGPLSLAFSVIGDTKDSLANMLSGGAPGPDRPMIVRTTAPDEKAVGELEEDMAIMARVLDKALERGDEEANDRKAMGIQLWALGHLDKSFRGSRNLYIEGHGAIFMVNVNTPLVAPAEKQKAEEKKESGNTSWDEARREVLGRNDEGGPRRLVRMRSAPAPFDAARVEAIQKNLIDALKNASNVRGLAENETITVVVQGPRNPQVVHAVSNGPGSKNEDVLTVDTKGVIGKSVMTFRAKKADIDAFANGKLDGDEFRKKTIVTAYQTGAGAVGEGFRYKGN
jgi:hypothetical protein